MSKTWFSCLKLKVNANFPGSQIHFISPFPLTFRIPTNSVPDIKFWILKHVQFYKKAFPRTFLFKDFENYARRLIFVKVSVFHNCFELYLILNDFMKILKRLDYCDYKSN
jgi:hypothetical protein